MVTGPLHGGPVLVTGAAGFVGGHLLARLTPAAAPLIAWHRPGGRMRPAALAGSGPAVPDTAIHWEGVDLLDREAVRRGLARHRPRVVYHCAGAAHIGESWATTTATLEANALATHYLLDALERESPGVRVLIPGSAAVYRASTEPLSEESPIGPASPYAVSKLAQEMLGVRAAAALPATIVVLLPRAFNHVGPGQDPSYAASSFARQIARIEAGLSAPMLSVGNLDARRDLTDVRDTVDAYVRIASDGVSGRLYNVCTGRAYPVREVLDRLLAMASCPVEIRVDPARLRPSDVPVLVGDAARIRRELGWRPHYSLDDTLRSILDFWRGVVRQERPAGQTGRHG